MGRAKGSPKTGGRQKGTPNKMTQDIRNMILASLDHRGGADYLNNLPDEEFNKLLVRVIPKDVKLDASDRIEWIVRDLTGRAPVKPKDDAASS